MNEDDKLVTKGIAAYHTRMKTARAILLYAQILEHLTQKKRYKDPNYTAAQLAVDLKTNTRYITTAVALHTGDNYSTLVNSMRLRDACRMLKSPRFRSYTVEEIGVMSGFANRQSFYIAFNKALGMTPRKFRVANIPEEERKLPRKRPEGTPHKTDKPKFLGDSEIRAKLAVKAAAKTAKSKKANSVPQKG